MQQFPSRWPGVILLHPLGLWVMQCFRGNELSTRLPHFFTLPWPQPCCSTAPSPLALRGSICSKEDLYVYFLKAIKETNVALFVGDEELVPRSAGRMCTHTCGLRESPRKRQPSPGHPTPCSTSWAGCSSCRAVWSSSGSVFVQHEQMQSCFLEVAHNGWNERTSQAFFFPLLHPPHHCTVFPGRICISLWKLPWEWTQLIPAGPCLDEHSLSTSISPTFKR